jgi:hypothetical protein
MRRTFVVGAVAGALALGAIGGAIALQTRAGDANRSSAKAIKQVKTTYGENLVGTSTTAWVTVASIPMTIPSGESDLVIARFDADTECGPTSPGVGSGVCQLRFRAVKGSAHPLLLPESMSTVLRVETGGVGEDNATLTIEKSRVLGAGAWTIVVQHRVTDPSIYFGIYSHHLTVERAPV